MNSSTSFVTQAEHESARRLVAVGDLHGDYGKTQRALRLAGLIDATDHWAGGDTVLVQVPFACASLRAALLARIRK